MIETRKSTARPRSIALKRPSCGTRRSVMSSSASTLTRAMACFGLLHVLDLLDLREYAVDAELDDQARRQGLEVDVARADLSASRSVERTRRTTSLVSSLIALSDKSSMRPRSSRGPATSACTASSARSVSSCAREDRRRGRRGAPAPRRRARRCALRPTRAARPRTGRRKRAAAGPRRRAAARSRAASIREGQDDRTPAPPAAARPSITCSSRSVAARRAVKSSGSAPSASSSTSTTRRRALPPRLRCARAISCGMMRGRSPARSLNLPGELEDRHVHEDHDHADDQADRRHEDRLEEAREPVHPARQSPRRGTRRCAPSSRPCCRCCSPTASMRSATGVVSPFASIDCDTPQPFADRAARRGEPRAQQRDAAAPRPCRAPGRAACRPAAAFRSCGRSARAGRP